MSTFIDLDSLWRDREIYPNPFSYGLHPSDTDTWITSARQVRANPQNKNTVPLAFASSVRIHSLIVPWSEELATIPKLYVNFEANSHKDVNLIQSIQNKHSHAKFVCIFSNTQYDPMGTPLWIHYHCTMEQVMRFKTRDTYKFEITTRGGDVPPNPDTDLNNPNPLQQTLCTFEILPYIRDGDYSNHFIETQTQ